MKVLKNMDITLNILVSLVLIALAATFWKGGWQLTWLGLVQAGHVVETVWLRILIGFTLGGLMQVLIPHDIIARWLGPTSGIKGILIGSYTAIIFAGAPYVFLPVVASLYAAGAGVGPTIALLMGQSVLGLQTLITWQIPFLGVGIPLSKFIVCLFITPLVGFAGAAVFKLLTRLPDTGIKSYGNISNVGHKDGENKVSQAVDKGEKTG